MFLRNVRGAYYVYLLRRPDGRPFYVGKGSSGRVFAHETEARHPNEPRSNAYKLNIIRSIRACGATLIYEIDLVTDDEAKAYTREAELIAAFKRLHEGGPLANLHPGGGSNAGMAPLSKERHAATLGGIPGDNPQRAALNRFVLGISRMNSIVLKPFSQFTPRPTQIWPTRTIGPTLRTAAALVASAVANGISLDGACRIPRRVSVDEVDGFVENGVACAVVMSGMGTLIPSDDPADEQFALTREQARETVAIVGYETSVDLGVVPPSD